MMQVTFLRVALSWLLMALLAATPAHAATSQHARVEGSNPNLGQRLILLERWARAHGGALPDVVIVGSSRSTYYDPRLVTRLTGATSFNAGISDGGAAAMRALVDWLQLRSGGTLPQLIVFVDVESFDARTLQVRTRIWQRRMNRALEAHDQDAGIRLARELASEATRRQAGAPGWHRYQRSDGLQVGGHLAAAEARGADMAAVRRRRIAMRVRTYERPDGYWRVEPRAVAELDHLLAVANEAGVVPLIVLTPTHPDCIRICGHAGWSARRREVKSALSRLATRRPMTWIDYSLPVMYGGSGRDFYDEIHLRPSGADAVLRSLERRGLLRSMSDRRAPTIADVVAQLRRDMAGIVRSLP